MKRFTIVLVLVLVLVLGHAFAQVIQSSNMTPWVIGSTVGVRGVIPTRDTNVVPFIDVTQPPYNADNTGATETSSRILNACDHIASNGVVYLPAGVYNCTGGFAINDQYFTFRGAGTNTIIVGAVSFGSGFGALSSPGDFFITNGATKGSTNIQLASMYRSSAAAEPISPGDVDMISGYLDPNANWDFQYQAVGGDANELRLLKQTVCILSTNMATHSVTFTPPLVCDMTNMLGGTNGGQIWPYSAQGGPGAGQGGDQARHLIGIENIVFTASNSPTLTSSAAALLTISPAVDFWVTNCSFLWGNSYPLELDGCVNGTIAHNNFRYTFRSGSDNAGTLYSLTSGILDEDNWRCDGFQPAVEINNSEGCVFFANYMTNNVLWYDIHKSHPAFNLIEENIGDSVQTDGYFGSASHFTLFRNYFSSAFRVLAFKRWTTHMQVAGNVLGKSSALYSNYLDVTNLTGASVGYSIIQSGFPNIGNDSYIGTAPPQAWNWPQFYAVYGTRTNGIWTFTNNQVSTTNLVGNFGYLTNADELQLSLLFQDPVNTNVYYSGITNSHGFPPSIPNAPGSTSNLMVQSYTTVSNGDTAYSVSVSTWQQIQLTNIYSDNIQGNWDAYHGAVFWNGNSPQSLVTSYLYTNGPPPYWGTNSWPAIDPLGSPMVTMIPAQERYLGLSAGGSGAIAAPLPPVIYTGSVRTGP